MVYVTVFPAPPYGEIAFYGQFGVGGVRSGLIEIAGQATLNVSDPSIRGSYT